MIDIDEKRCDAEVRLVKKGHVTVAVRKTEGEVLTNEIVLGTRDALRNREAE
jgi:hypothetical protein